MKRRSVEEWEEILAAYATRTGSKEAFCREHDVKSSALSYQLERRSGKKRVNFSEAKTEKAATSSSEAVVEFPSGIRLRVLG